MWLVQMKMGCKHKIHKGFQRLSLQKKKKVKYLNNILH